MSVLAFRLYAPLAAWGTGEAGETERPTAGHPGRSHIVGLLAAALGLQRTDEAAQRDLAAGYRFAVAAQGTRQPLRDYRTVQTVEPNRAQRKNGFVSRKHALETGAKVHTMITRRSYLQDGLWRVFAAPKQDGAAPPPDALADALRAPAFELYLGRRDCPPALPPDPVVLPEQEWEAQLAAYPAVPAGLCVRPVPGGLRQLAARLARHPVTLAWEPGFPGAPDPDAAGTSRRQVADQPLSRVLRRFASREEVSRTLANPEAPSREG
ncbi:type I-E CRISPR-associated protein Cas5/CasD [Rhodovibrio sodomensis]|uniref:Type I-E CRISPR-associated protein Cas5/CasD n=1 Tax=Rhodovibrio sodomensis TaxID=1088 RepID=A0ABS1DGA5_9PROT|nr:type I-E CRISPR-associated protein Cas5/CasD [Rhodovibrio sodomensis]MBK1669504.1 type I-E CRISPR-associated protein Cas5/CasD [Rhodovibrio sodomensis]